MFFMALFFNLIYLLSWHFSKILQQTEKCTEVFFYHRSSEQYRVQCEFRYMLPGDNVCGAGLVI